MDAGPCHAAAVSPDVNAPKDVAAESSSPARPSQAAAASNIGIDPAPENIRSELISGGSNENVISTFLPRPSEGVNMADGILGRSPASAPAFLQNRSDRSVATS
ncbi:hypothetical protein Mkiyose1088_47110 [Mycobacterium kiyosense]|nr:hypothetical protein Mkiyose1088_47110 [Mycobacterium kiyosense]